MVVMVMILGRGAHGSLGVRGDDVVAAGEASPRGRGGEKASSM